MFNYFNAWGQPGFAGLGILVLAIFVLWTIFWKGLALWKSARLGHKKWFVALLLLNTVGILDILYIYIWSKPAHQRHHHPNDHHHNGGHIAETSSV